ncbi:MAG TPA: amino acid permease [Planctomycetaceae bacterium]|jgi:amino acid transporter|nr:amino acid permease [Planctomycetaceae bacterium]
MLVEGKRPRELCWYHAGPMLFGDWGTSRLYVLGLAFYYTRHAALWYMLAMSVILVAVGWAYQNICRIYPDGGGVYSSARHRSPTLAVIGGLLLCADYLVTAAISALDAFHYLNLNFGRPVVFAIAALIGIGAVNYLGPKKSGALALVVALATVALTLVIGIWAVPSLGKAHVSHPEGSPLHCWVQFTSLILAISGVEAIANMTGLMVEPVEKTSAKSIYSVLCEIVVLNLVLTVAMLAMPLDVLGDGNPDAAYSAHRDDMLRVIASYYVGPAFAAVAAVVFAMLLLSAANTAITDLVSIQFMMARDKELPAALGLLNTWGMPVLPLILATLFPVAILMAVADVEQLADLYAIGVVGAVAINLGSCATNFQVELTRFQRIGMGLIALVMTAIWITIAIEKPHALIFASCILVVGLIARFLFRHRDEVRHWILEEFSATRLVLPNAPPHPASVSAASLEAISTTVPALHDEADEALNPQRTGGRILLTTRGNVPVFRFALERAKRQKAELFVVFVRNLAVPALGTPSTPDYEADAAAKKFFEIVSRESQGSGVTVHSDYAVARNVARTILSLATGLGVDTLILAAPQHGVLWRAVKGNVLKTVTRRLPKHIELIVRSEKGSGRPKPTVS